MEMYKYRLLRKEKLLRDKFMVSVDLMQRSMSHFGNMSKRWIGVRIGLLNALLVFTAYFLSIVCVLRLDSIYHLSNLEIAIAFTWSLKVVAHVDVLFTNLV